MRSTIPPGRCGAWSVEQFAIDEAGARDHNYIANRDAAMLKRAPRHVAPGTYTRLCCGGEVIMSDTTAEIADFQALLDHADGDILITGLGLGLVAQACLRLQAVTSVTVIEQAAEVIQLVGPHLTDPRLQIIHDDAYTWQPPPGRRYGAIWHDIWPFIEPENLPGMLALRTRYRPYAAWQGCWGYADCVRMANYEPERRSNPLASR